MEEHWPEGRDCLPRKAACESGTVWYMMFETTCVKLWSGRPEFCSHVQHGNLNKLRSYSSPSSS